MYFKLHTKFAQTTAKNYDFRTFQDTFSFKMAKKTFTEQIKIHSNDYYFAWALHPDNVPTFFAESGKRFLTNYSIILRHVTFLCLPRKTTFK